MGESCSTKHSLRLILRVFNLPRLPLLIPLGILLFLLVGTGNRWGIWHLSLASLLILAVLYLSPLHRIFSNRVPVFLGRISFGVYLTHLPILCSLGSASYLASYNSIGHTAAMWCSASLSLITSLLLGWLLHRTGDTLGIRWSRSLSRRLRPSNLKLPHEKR